MKIFITAINTALIASLSLATAAFGSGRAAPLVVNHLNTILADIPREAIQGAIDNLVIAYGHTSHGSQLVTGMDSLAAFVGDDIYSWSMDGSDGTLELRDKAMPYDLGYASWEPDTRAYLDIHPEVNVVIWSWCGQVVNATEAYIDEYLDDMTALEIDYPNVSFVYMTDHLAGWTYGTNPFLRNQQIRDYCVDNNKILYDFTDIEAYDPDGIYYADRRANDNCDYDSDGDGILEIGVDANWAIDWQNANPDGWYDCLAAHTQPLNPRPAQGSRFTMRPENSAERLSTKCSPKVRIRFYGTAKTNRETGSIQASISIESPREGVLPHRAKWFFSGSALAQVFGPDLDVFSQTPRVVRSVPLSPVPPGPVPGWRQPIQTPM